MHKKYLLSLFVLILAFVFFSSPQLIKAVDDPTKPPACPNCPQGEHCNVSKGVCVPDTSTPIGTGTVIVTIRIQSSKALKTAEVTDEQGKSTSYNLMSVGNDTYTFNVILGEESQILKVKAGGQTITIEVPAALEVRVTRGEAGVRSEDLEMEIEDVLAATKKRWWTFGFGDKKEDEVRAVADIAQKQANNIVVARLNDVAQELKSLWVQLGAFQDEYGLKWGDTQKSKFKDILNYVEDVQSSLLEEERDLREGRGEGEDLCGNADGIQSLDFLTNILGYRESTIIKPSYQENTYNFIKEGGLCDLCKSKRGDPTPPAGFQDSVPAGYDWNPKTFECTRKPTLGGWIKGLFVKDRPSVVTPRPGTGTEEPTPPASGCSINEDQCKNLGCQWVDNFGGYTGCTTVPDPNSAVANCTLNAANCNKYGCSWVNTGIAAINGYICTTP